MSAIFPLNDPSFRSGAINASDWPTTVVDGGDLSVVAAAAYKGRFGLQGVVDDATAIYLLSAASSLGAAQEIYWRTALRLSANWTMANNDLYRHIVFYDSVAGSWFLLEFKYTDAWGEVRIAVLEVDDTATPTTTGNGTNDAISLDEWHEIKGYAKCADVDADNGEFWVELDGTKIIERSGIDNDTRDFDKVNCGFTGGDAGTSGTFSLDDILIGTAEDDLIWPARGHWWWR